MKRVVEKVKDIVEICPFTHLQDFAADPGLTLAGYHFTDITADLMSKWIDRVAAVRSGQGTACALAGFRGVGKSHFLSVLAAIIARPELRSRISDSHVASTAERLSRRHGNVAFVRRGSGASLLDELKRAIGLILETAPSELTDSLYDLLLRASDRLGDAPLVVLIDTAAGRDTRVSRDDGLVLSEIAEAAKAIGVFVGVALDDDISGADGPNASIASTFSIDYLDQEHLYKIVDSVIFSKHNNMRGVLHEIYEDYRDQMPGFRWSAQRFASLYPLHPATVEIAPLIRLYIHDFALLGFAAEAGVKILGRPANSLIGLDEVFDGVEQKLRTVSDLQEVFAAFDQIERDVVGKTPVLFRHPAKLILKGLLILSLNGQGASADEIAASMMIFGSGSGDFPSLNVEELLESFAAELPNSLDRYPREGAPTKYCFRIGSKVDVESLLSAAATKVPDDLVWKSLITQSAEKWSDFDGASRYVSCIAEWRGSIRRGELIWPPAEGEEESRERKEQPDWTIKIEPEGEGVQPAEPEATAVWKVAKLTIDEVEAIKRHHLLLNDVEIREQAGESLSAALHVSAVAVEKAWNRVFFRDGHLVAKGQIHKFGDNSRAEHSLSEIVSPALSSIFDALYPEHPIFSDTLGFKQVAELIATFLSGSGASNSDSQKLAETFAIPLNLAENSGEAIIPVASERLAELKYVKTGFDFSGDEGALPLTEVAARLAKQPFGFTRETQHVVMAALVAQKRFEFVTSSGNRINYRSLDLQIIWDDIVGLAKPLNEQYSAGRLLVWAKLITGNAAIRSIDRPEDHALIVDSLAGWLSGWNQSKILSDFDALPEDCLSASIWRTAANLRKSFGAMAELIDSLVKKDLSLDQCLQLIADLFSDSESEFEAKKLDLRILRDFTAGVRMRSEIRTYLTLCENTGEEMIENSRGTLLKALDSGKFNAVNETGDQFVEVWKNFKEIYGAYYSERHEAVMGSDPSGDRLKEIIRSESWSVFEGLSSINWLDRTYFDRARAIIREMRQLNCGANVTESLKLRPFCGCSFSVAETERLMHLPLELEAVVKRGIEEYRKAFTKHEQALVESCDSDAMGSSVAKVVAELRQNGLPSITSQDIRVLKIAAEKISTGVSTRNVAGTEMSEGGQREELWEAEIQKVEEFVNTEI